MPEHESTKKSTDSTVETLNTVNLKTVGEAAAFAVALAYQNAVAHQGAMNDIRLATVGAIVKNLTEVDATQAMSILKMTTGNDVASQIANLLAAVTSGQQQVKAAQTTPPVTP